MNPSIHHVEIVREPIEVARLAAQLCDGDCGAYASFEGWVRNHNEGRAVAALEYEVFHDLALEECRSIMDEAVHRFGLRGVRVSHREGALRIGDCAVYVGVTAPHRTEAFAGCRFIIDAVKHRLPIWKKEHYVDGSHEWVNCRHSPAPVAAPLESTAQSPIDPHQFYARQTVLNEVGMTGQARLGRARVLIIGVGGLGCAAATALAAAGVGHIGLADYDRVEISNLHRQTLFAVEDVGKPKAVIAKDKLLARNPLIEIAVFPLRIDADSLRELCERFDLLLDCSDNFRTKYLSSDAAVRFKRPVIQASIYRYEGQLLAIEPDGDGGCLRCLWPQPPESGLIGDCAEAGVIGTVPISLGTQQAHMAIMYLLGESDKFGLDLRTYDMNSGVAQQFERHRDPHCPACGTDRRIDLSKAENALEIELPDEVPRDEFLQRFTLIDVREASERHADPLPAAIHMPASRFDAGSIVADGNKPYLIVCARGQRSLQAVRKMRELGHTRAFSLQGGMMSLHEGLHR